MKTSVLIDFLLDSRNILKPGQFSLRRMLEKHGKIVEPIYDGAVFIGRFQPMHKEHLKTIKLGLAVAKHMVVVLGSARRPRDPKNPWKDQEREAMIRANLTEEENTRVSFFPIQDFWYNNPLWFTKVGEGVTKILNENLIKGKVVILGYEKDATSFYLKGFPQWEFLPYYSEPTVNATNIREVIFASKDSFNEKNFVDFDLSESTQKYLLDWSKKNPELLDYLVKEFQFLKDYKAKWAAAPFKPTFVTTDCLVMMSAHILLIRRGFNPGKGLLALPGGFLNQEESLEDSALRELFEETKIRVSEPELRHSIVTSKVFAHPQRDLRGRTITHAFLIDLGIGPLPLVKGSDDAAEAIWLPLSEVHNRVEEFFGDHYAIITNLVHAL